MNNKNIFAAALHVTDLVRIKFLVKIREMKWKPFTKYSTGQETGYSIPYIESS